MVICYWKYDKYLMLKNFELVIGHWNNGSILLLKTVNSSEVENFSRVSLGRRVE